MRGVGKAARSSNEEQIMIPEAVMPSVVHAVQLAVAPVFLLTGLAGMLNVIATRLSRVIDRARSLEREWASLDAHDVESAQVEYRSLERRRRLCSQAINQCTAAALVVCFVVVLLFLQDFFSTRLGWVIGGLFVLAMVLLIGGLSCFLREVSIATHTTSLNPERLRRPAQ